MIELLFKKFIIQMPLFLMSILTITFLLIHFIPGDPVDVMLGEWASVEEKQNLTKELKLDLPLVTQYKSFLVQFWTGNWGESLITGIPIKKSLFQKFGNTLKLSFVSIFFAILIGLSMGLVSSYFHRSFWDKAFSIFSVLSLSVPAVILGPVLMYVFCIHFDLLPVGGLNDGLASYVLPALSLALPLGAVIARISRSSLLDVKQMDFVRTAHAKGLKPFKVYTKHTLRNALITILTVIGLQFGSLLTGTVVTETLFSWPGLGSYLLEGIQSRDYPLVQLCVCFMGILFVLINTLTDISYSVADPRVRIKA